MENRQHDISVQRNELRNCLGELCDKIRHGAYNHMFKEKNQRASGEDKETCEKGHKRYDVIWSAGGCCGDCDGCGKDCQLSYEEKRLFDAMANAVSAVNKPDAEMPRVEPKDFPEYNPDVVYKATDRWIARNLYRFAIGYWLFTDHKDRAVEMEWERAFGDLLAICLDSIGKDGMAIRSFFRTVREVEDKGLDSKALEKEAEKLKDENPQAVKLIDEAVGFIFEKNVEQENAKWLVFSALTIRMDYSFGHKYPGGDMDVYDGAFCGLIDVALKIAGLYEKEVWQGDGESKAEYDRRVAETKARKKDRIYAFMEEQDGLEVKPRVISGK